MSDVTDYNVRAVERALQILKSFDDQHPERGVTEIAEVVGLHKATAHRILSTMINYGFIERSADGLKYRLGVQLVDLGFKVTRRMDLRREAMPYITKLAQQVNEAVDLSIWDQSQVLYIEMVQSQHALTIAASIGQRLPAYCTASGKVFLAHLGDTVLSGYLETPLHIFTKNTISTPEELRKELLAVKEKGYAIDSEEFEYGVRAIAAPVFNQQDHIIGAVSIPGPSNRLQPERISEIVPMLMQTTREISRRMGWVK
jgi:IclR family transcriptional regulator, KDG regulon repressor